MMMQFRQNAWYIKPLQILPRYFFINPSSPKGVAITPPPNSFRPGAQKRVAKV